MKSKITIDNVTSFLTSISANAVSDKGRSNLPSFNTIASQNNIYPGFATELKNQLLSKGLIVNYGNKISWNPSFSKPNEMMAKNFIKKVLDARTQTIKNRAIAKTSIKPDIKSEPNFVSIKDLSDKLLVTELRERGFEVRCEKILVLWFDIIRHC